MAERKALVLIDGQIKELPTGDTLAGSSGGGVQANIAPVTIYVNNSSGSDSNSGLTSGASVATIGKALEIAANYQGTGGVQLDLQGGTYASIPNLPAFAGAIFIGSSTGNATISSSVIASTVNLFSIENIVITGILTISATVATLSNVTCQSLQATLGAKVSANNITLDVTGSAIPILASLGATVYVDTVLYDGGPITPGVYYLYCESGSSISLSSFSTTITDTTAASYYIANNSTVVTDTLAWSVPGRIDASFLGEDCSINGAYPTLIDFGSLLTAGRGIFLP